MMAFTFGRHDLSEGMIPCMHAFFRLALFELTRDVLCFHMLHVYRTKDTAAIHVNGQTCHTKHAHCQQAASISPCRQLSWLYP